MERESVSESPTVERKTSLANFRHAVRRVANTLHHFHSDHSNHSHCNETGRLRKLNSLSLLGRFRSRTMDDVDLQTTSVSSKSTARNARPCTVDDTWNSQEEPMGQQVNKSGISQHLSRHQSHPQLPLTDEVTAKTSEIYSPSCCGPGEGHVTSDSLPPEKDTVRVFKKISSNGKLTLYLINRDLVISNEVVSPLYGIVTVDPEELRNRKIFAQIMLTFRYGRDDEEVMGLKLSNESVICAEQIYPSLSTNQQPALSPSQEVLLRRLGPDAFPICMKLNRQAPPSVRLLPAKEYRGAAIGISYELRVYTENTEERPQRRNQVRMAIRLVQYATTELQQAIPPLLSVEKNFLLREGTIRLDVGLDRKWYTHGTPIVITIRIHNGSSRVIRKIRITAIQHVDVSMFSNGKFKNIVALCEECEGLPNGSSNSLERQYQINLLESGGGRHWVALEDRYGRLTATLASTTLKSTPNERNFFAIYVSYYIKVRLVVSGVGGDVTVKIPFILMRDGPESFNGEIEEMFTSSRSLDQKVPSPTTHSDCPFVVSQQTDAEQEAISPEEKPGIFSSQYPNSEGENGNLGSQSPSCEKTTTDVSN